MAARIDTQTQRLKLQPRREPYWRKLATRQYIGFRRTETGGSWIARLTREDQSKTYQALGAGPSFDLPEDKQPDALTFDRAFKAALDWFSQAGQADTRCTVKLAVSDYVAHLEVEKGGRASTDAKQRLEKHLIPKYGKVELLSLTTRQLKAWRDSLVRVSDDPEDVRKSKDSANRVLSMAKAAFNLAFRSGLISSDTAWKRVPGFKDVGEARKLFLTDEQVKSLLEHAQGGLRHLLRAGVLTGARYGELTTARVHDLDVIHGTLRLTGKTGTRDCYLSDEALTFFNERVKDKLPEAWLLTRDDGERWGKSHQDRPIKEAVRAAKLPAGTVFYSLRHYHISKALLAGISPQVIAENCGTSIRMIEKHYGKFMPKDRRAMLNKVALP